MVKKHYLPRALDTRVKWLNNFAGRFEEHGTELGFTKEEIQEVKNDAAMLSYAAKVHHIMQGTHKSFTAFKDMLNEGAARKQQVEVPELPSLPKAPVPVAPGIFRRTGKLVQRIKYRKGYTELMGLSMGIIGSEQKVIIANAKPTLKAKVVGNNLVLHWKKRVFDGIVMYVNSNDGNGFAKEMYFSRSPAKIKIKLPTGEHSGLWQLKASYRLKDDIVGQSSAIVEVAVRN